MSRLDEIKARCDAATEGPWEAKEGFTSDPMIEVYGQTVFINPDLDGDPIQPEVWADVEFISAAREDVPWLLALVESLTAERDALQVGRDRDRVKGAVAVLNEELRTSEQEDRAQKAEAEVERLTEAYQWTDQVLTAVTAERDALAAQVTRVESLAEDWRYKGQFGWGAWQIGEGPDPEGYVMDHCASALRAALAGPEADTTDNQSTDQEDQA